MTWIDLLAVFIILFASSADGVRDAWMSLGKGWWPRHIAKWAAFYPPLVFIGVTHVGILWTISLSVPAWILWRLSSRYIGGVQWESHWVRYIKSIFGGGE